MKKILLFLSTAVLLCACQKASQPTDKPVEPSTMPSLKKLEVTFDVTEISQDVLDYFNVTYNYTDFDGNAVSAPITGDTSIVFSMPNPQLDTISNKCPFSVEISMIEKGTAAKASGRYDTTLKYELDINGYLADDSKILGSGYAIRTNLTFSYDKLSSFITVMKTAGNYRKRTYSMSLGRNVITKEWQLGWTSE